MRPPVGCVPGAMRWSHNYWLTPNTSLLRPKRDRCVKCGRLIASSRSRGLESDGIEPLIELKPLKEDEKLATTMEDRIRDLAALDRYERRAISRRKSAIRVFDSACRSRSNSKLRHVKQRVRRDKLLRTGFWQNEPNWPPSRSHPQPERRKAAKRGGPSQSRDVSFEAYAKSIDIFVLRRQDTT
jgi:hypothetical protein